MHLITVLLACIVAGVQSFHPTTGRGAPHRAAADAHRSLRQRAPLFFRNGADPFTELIDEPLVVRDVRSTSHTSAETAWHFDSDADSDADASSEACKFVHTLDCSRDEAMHAPVASAELAAWERLNAHSEVAAFDANADWHAMDDLFLLCFDDKLADTTNDAARRPASGMSHSRLPFRRGSNVLRHARGQPSQWSKSAARLCITVAAAAGAAARLCLL